MPPFYEPRIPPCDTSGTLLTSEVSPSYDADGDPPLHKMGKRGGENGAMCRKRYSSLPSEDRLQLNIKDSET